MAFSRTRSKLLYLATIVACFGLFAALTAPVKAANPTTISFQGKVVNANGTNVTDGTYGFVFKLYTAGSGGSAIWTETDSLSVSAGVFQVNLGASCPFFTANACNGSTPIDFNANPNLYLGITFNSDPAGEMTPRVQLQSVPFAFNADRVGGLTVDQLVQLSPGSQQSGFINVSGDGTFGGAVTATGALQGDSLSVNGGLFAVDNTGAITASDNITNGGTYNGDTLTGASLGFSTASPNTIVGATNQNLTLQAVGAGELMLDSGSGTLGLASDVATIQRVAAGTTTLDLDDTANTTLGLDNSGGGAANLNLVSGALATGATATVRLTNAGVLQNITGLTVTKGNVSFKENAANTFSVSATQVPTSDMMDITNTGKPITTDGINAEQVDYYAALSNASYDASALRVNITNTSAVAGSTTNALHLVTTTSAAAGDTNALLIDGVTAGTGTATAINIGTGWNSLLSYNGTSLISGTGALQNTALSGAYSGITGTGTLVSGAIGSGFGAISTGNAITTTAAVQGGTVTATGALSGNSLSINSGVFAVNSAGAITASTGATVTGSVSASTSVITPTLTASGALVINSGAANNVTVDSAGAGTAAINIGGTNATSVALSRTGQTTTVNGALAVDQNATFNSNVIMTFSGTENLAVTSALGGSVNGISFIGTPSATAGTTNGLFIQQASSANTNGLDNGLTIDNADNSDLIGAALNITNTGGGGYTDYIDSPNFIVAGTGQMYGKGFNYFDPSTLTASGALLNSGGAAGGNFGGAFDAGAFIGTDDTYDQEFVGSIAAATTNNANAGDDGLWYFNNNAQASITGGDTSTTGGYYELSAPATNNRGALLAMGATPGTLDKPLDAGNLPILQMKVRISAARATDDLIFGAFDTATATVTNDALPTNGFVFWTDNSTGTTGWQGVVRSGGTTVGTTTCPTSADVTAGQFAVGRIVVVNSTTVHFYIDSNVSNGPVSLVDCGVVTGTLPAAALSMGMYLVQTVATATTADMDYARFWQDDAAPANEGQAAAATTAEQTQADISTASDDAGNSVSSVGVTGTASNNSSAAALSPAPTDGSSAPPPDPTVSGSSATDTSDLQVKATSSDSGFQLEDASGKQVAEVDTNGNTVLSGGLNAASATLSGALSVGGNSSFDGLSTFEKLATFLDRAIFHGNVEFQGQVTVSNDTAGYASLRTGESKVHVSFSKPYANPPIVTASVSNGQFVSSSIANVTPQGFDIELQKPASAPTTFSWTAIGVTSPQTATNPLASGDSTAQGPVSN